MAVCGGSSPVASSGDTQPRWWGQPCQPLALACTGTSRPAAPFALPLPLGQGRGLVIYRGDVFYLKQVKQKPGLFCGAQASWGDQPRQMTPLPFIKHLWPGDQLVLGTGWDNLLPFTASATGVISDVSARAELCPGGTSSPFQCLSDIQGQ